MGEIDGEIDGEGDALGERDGDTLGDAEGLSLGANVGLLGEADGLADGLPLGAGHWTLLPYETAPLPSGQLVPGVISALKQQRQSSSSQTAPVHDVQSISTAAVEAAAASLGWCSRSLPHVYGLVDVPPLSWQLTLAPLGLLYTSMRWQVEDWRLVAAVQRTTHTSSSSSSHP